MRFRSALGSLGGIAGAALLGTLLCRVAAGYFVPSAAYGTAAVNGSLDALFAVGLVLVYRANRVVSFAQGSLGVLGATLFTALVRFESWPVAVAFPVAVLAAAATGLVVEVFVVRRLSQAPRLALTVATIGVGQVLLAGAGLLALFFVGGEDDVTPRPVRTPLSGIEWRWDPLVFTGDHVLVLVVALLAMAGLAAFFRFSSVGVAVRGAAENGDRAELLGISVNNLSSLVWVIAGTLSGLAAILATPVSPGAIGAAGAGSASASLLLRGLTAAVVGRMERIPLTVAAAFAIAVFDQSMFWAFDSTALTSAALLGLIVVVLFLQRGRATRTDPSSTWAATEEVRPIPHELRDLLQVRTGVRRARLLLGAGALAFPWVMSPSQTSLGSLYVLYGIVVISLVVLTGWGGQISLGQFAFSAVGAVLGGALTATVGMPFLPAIVLAAVAGALVAVAVGLPAMRIQGLFLAVTTLAFAVTVTNVVLNPDLFGWLLPDGDIPRPKILFVDTADERVFFYLCTLALAFAYWVARGLRSSRAGRVLIAMRDNERTAQGYGINRVRTRLATFAVSGFLASFAGALLVHQQLTIRAKAFTPEQSVQLFLIAVIGGLGSLGGSLLGVAYIAAVNLLVPGTAGPLLLSGAGVVGIMLFYPSGLGGLFFAGRDAWLRRVAMRARIDVPSLLGTARAVPGELPRATLAARVAGGTRAENAVPVKYRIRSTVRERGKSQAAHRWRYG